MNLLNDSGFIKKLIEFSFHRPSAIAISFCSIPVLSSFGCNSENCLVFDFDYDADRLEISTIVDFKPIPFCRVEVNFLKGMFSIENVNELVEYLKVKVFPLISSTLFNSSFGIEIEKRQLVCQNVIVNGLTHLDTLPASTGKGSNVNASGEFRSLLVRELDLYFCNSPLAAENQPQDFSLGRLPDYFSGIKNKFEMIAWIGGCIYSRFCFSDSKTFLSMEEYRSGCNKISKKYII